MSASLNVIALISGGKDSLYSILHCIEAGHKVVALANLYPAPQQHGEKYSGSKEDDVEDIDSFMYQTVGHRVIPLYSEALGLPLYRRAIAGNAVQIQRDYAVPTGIDQHLDETEDLMPLLKEVLKNHPQANAVSTGAILSTYQRTRVESVAIRLGLTPLSYLWQYPFLPSSTAIPSVTGLLDDMAAVGCDARIIKIATAGIDDAMLWANVCNITTRTRLVNGMQRFVEDDVDALKAAVIGEGGEFETLALSGPAPVWKKKLAVDDSSNTRVRGEGGTSSIKVGPVRLLDNTDEHEGREPELRCPPLFDAMFENVRESCADISRVAETISHEEGQHGESFGRFPTTSVESSSVVYISNLQFSISVTKAELRTSLISVLSTLDSLNEIQSQAQGPSEEILTRVVFATLLVRSMSSFGEVNSLWMSLFSGRPNPPARVTISCGGLLPKGIDFSVSLVADKGPRSRRDGLHVQSWSYWAPANIGPYSQSIRVPLVFYQQGARYTGRSDHDCKLVYVAGQIPLIPSTMLLASDSFVQQTVLSLQHLWRIGIVQKAESWLYGIAFLAHDMPSVISEKARVAYTAWKQTHSQSLKASIPSDDDEDNEDGPDAWDLKYGNYQEQSFNSRRTTAGPTHQIPSLKTLSHSSGTTCPPFIAAEISSLPRSASLEWQSLGTIGLKPSVHPKSDTKAVSKSNTRIDARIHTTHYSHGGSMASFSEAVCMESHVVTIPVPSQHFSIVEGGSALQHAIARAVSDIKSSALEHGLRTAHITIYTSMTGIWEYLNEEIQGISMIVPCFSVWCGIDSLDLELGETTRNVLQKEDLKEALLAMIVRCEQ